MILGCENGFISILPIEGEMETEEEDDEDRESGKQDEVEEEKVN